MAARTDDGLVKGVLLLDYDSVRNPVLTPFITVANVLTNRIAAMGASTGAEVPADELVLLETWLAAHAYCMSDQPYASKSTKGASATFQGKTDMRLKATKYGQMALDLDPTGYLASIDSGAQATADMESLDRGNS